MYHWDSVAKGDPKVGKVVTFGTPLELYWVRVAATGRPASLKYTEHDSKSTILATFEYHFVPCIIGIWLQKAIQK